MKSSTDWLHNIVNVLNMTKLYAQNGEDNKFYVASFPFVFTMPVRSGIRVMLVFLKELESF